MKRPPRPVRRVQLQISVMLFCVAWALPCLSLAAIGTLLVIPATPVEGGLLQVRFIGPFGQPVPFLSLRVEGTRIIARTARVDFVDPRLPQVPFVEAAIGAPAAGIYSFEHELCSGNPPPPIPDCSIVSSQSLVITAAAQIPFVSKSVQMLLWIALGALGLFRLSLGRGRD